MALPCVCSEVSASCSSTKAMVWSSGRCGMAALTCCCRASTAGSFWRCSAHTPSFAIKQASTALQTVNRKVYQGSKTQPMVCLSGPHHQRSRTLHCKLAWQLRASAQTADCLASLQCRSTCQVGHASIQEAAQARASSHIAIHDLLSISSCHHLNLWGVRIQASQHALQRFGCPCKKSRPGPNCTCLHSAMLLHVAHAGNGPIA